MGVNYHPHYHDNKKAIMVLEGLFSVIISVGKTRNKHQKEYGLGSIYQNAHRGYDVLLMYYCKSVGDVNSEREYC